MRSLTEIIELAEHWAKHEPKAAPAELYSLVRDLAMYLKQLEPLGKLNSAIL